MNNIDKLLDAFLNGDYFIIFLILTLIILIVLVLALIKTRSDYNELLEYELNKKKLENDENKEETIEIKEPEAIKEDNLLSDLENLMANNKEDEINKDEPLTNQIETTPQYDKVINDYAYNEEENAVISAEELEIRAKQRMDELGTTENQKAIAMYEEEQENKAIISYEQLLKNTSNIKVSYTEEQLKGKDAPKVNKVEVEREVVGPELYLAEDEFLKILKEFRLSLNENIFS